MTRFPIEPHFVYSQGFDTTTFPSWNGYHVENARANGNIYNETTFVQNVFLPNINLPALGNTHTHRRGNRITVTTIRTKIHMVLNPRWCSVFRPNTSPGSTHFTDLEMSTPAIKRFFKCRFMVVQFNDELHIDAEEIGKWFYATYCWFMNDYDQEADANYINQPISVHSNILRLTTPYTGKFNILMDRPITITSTRPQQVLDVNIPLNKSFVFDEDDPTKLLFPNIWAFILPPLNFYTDVDPLTAYQLKDWYAKPESSVATQADSQFPFLQTMYFAKLNFVDL